MQTKLSHRVTVKFKKLSPCKIKKANCDCELWRQNFHHVKCKKKVSHHVTVKFKKMFTMWKCLTVWLWNLKKKKISAKKLTVFDFHSVKCKKTISPCECEIGEKTRIDNLTVWMWNCSLSPLAISILLSATINHVSGWFAQFCSWLSLIGIPRLWKWVLLAPFPIGGPRFW